MSRLVTFLLLSESIRDLISPRMTVYLNRLGHQVNHKRVARLMREMGIEGIRPKKNLSKAQPGYKIYPYLLRDLEVAKPNQVWTADITYIRLTQGFIYLVAVMDWYSRYVLRRWKTRSEKAFQRYPIQIKGASLRAMNIRGC